MGRRGAGGAAPGCRALNAPVSICEVDLGSWRLKPLEGSRSLNYLELADELSAYARDTGFTHIELMPVTAQRLLGLPGHRRRRAHAALRLAGRLPPLRRPAASQRRRRILDWVPAHFPRHDFALARFGGTALDERRGPASRPPSDRGPLVFSHGRNEVRNFLLANALYWPCEYHVDGIRVDAVASMLYSTTRVRRGRERPTSTAATRTSMPCPVFKEYNEVVHRREPGVIRRRRSRGHGRGSRGRPTSVGSASVSKWNMGWMHDTLAYFQHEPIHRRWHHHEPTFSLAYAFTENFILRLSHDEVVHRKGSMLSKMPDDRSQQLANLRAMYPFMCAHPCKKLLFMGNELAQEQEWSDERSLDWRLQEKPAHSGIQSLARDLIRAYRDAPALSERDYDHTAFWWLEPNDAEDSVCAFASIGEDASKPVVFVANLTPMSRHGYPLVLPVSGR